MKNSILLTGLLMTLLFACKSPSSSLSFNPYVYSGQKEMTVSHAAVVSAHPLASAVGLEILRAGGNAVDAAIATQLALAVVYPGAGNIGGGGFMVARLADGQLVSLDYREEAPGRATRNMYVDDNGTAHTEKSQNGHLAAAVPGTVAGLFASARYAKLPFAKLIQPAINLAEKGFVITEAEAGSLTRLQERLEKYNSVMPVFFRREGWEKGDTLIQKDLAETLKRIRDKGQAGFYEGKTAELIVDEMKRGAGFITAQDLKEYKAKWRDPHVFDYEGYKIVSMPMPSSGGVLLHQMLGMIEPFKIRDMKFHSTAAVELMVEAERRAFADRAEYMGDPDFFAVPSAELTDKGYMATRMEDYTPGRASKSEEIGAGKIPVPEHEETTHLSVIDDAGNMVSVTTTLNGGYGSGTVVGHAGFFLNNEMDDFSIQPGVPNMYGAVGGEANSIAPGKRMLSSMTPTVVLKDDKPFLVVGTPGGTTIPTSVYQTIVNIVDFGLSPDEAVNEPKFHHQWQPDVVVTEKGFPEAVIDSLRAAGYTVTPRNGGIGRTELIQVLPDGRFRAVADSRGDDAAAGY